MAKFINYGGNFMPQQPARSSGSQVFLFGVAADEQKVQALCDRTLNLRDATGEPAHPDLEYRALTPLLFLLFMKMDRICSVDPPDDTSGALRENELNIAIPLVAFERRLGFMVPVRLVWYMPYLWIDSGVCMSLGRETYGFPKMMGDVVIPAGLGAAANFSVRAETWDPAQTTPPCRQQQILCVRRTDGASVESERHEAELERVIHALFPALHLPALVEPLITAASFFGGVHFVFLKQFRDHADGREACYQAIVEAPVTYPAFHGAHWLEGNYEVQIADFASAPLVRELGFAGANAAGNLATQQTHLAALLSFDFILGKGRTMWAAP